MRTATLESEFAGLSEHTDPLLVERAQHGDRAAFGELVTRYEKRIYELAYGFARQREEAWDLVQEVFLRAYRGLANFRNESSFYTWLYCIAQHTCTDYVRKQARQKRVLRFVDLFSGDVPLVCPRQHERPDSHLERAELAHEIRQAVGQLPPQQQRVFVLRHYEGLALQEIADVMGIRIGSVKAHLFNATHRMRKLLAVYLQADSAATDVVGTPQHS